MYLIETIIKSTRIIINGALQQALSRLDAKMPDDLHNTSLKNTSKKYVGLNTGNLWPPKLNIKLINCY